MIVPEGTEAPERLLADRQWWLGRLERAARLTRRGSDPEAVHDVRVATRQLEAYLDLWWLILPGGRRRRARRALDRLRRDLAPVREVDVSLTLLHERMATLPPDARVAGALLEELLRPRLERHAGRAGRRCARPVIGRVRRRFEQAWDGVALDREPATSTLLSGRARLAKRRTTGHAALRKAVEDDTNKSLHSARVAAKRWRYMLERLAATDPSVDVSELPWLKAVQRRLGRIQDLSVLRERAVRLSPRLASAECGATSEAMRSLLKAFQAERAVCVRAFSRLAAAGASGSPRAAEAEPPALRLHGA